MKLNNKYYIMRHGEALSNVKEIVSSWPEKFENPLTRKGREMVKKSVGELKGIKIDLIFNSDLLRTQETADIVGKILNVKPQQDKKLREIQFGTLNGGSVEHFVKYFENREQRIKKGTPGGESYLDVSKRVAGFLKEIDRKYKNKNILIVSHQLPLFILEGYVDGLSLLKVIREFPAERMLRRGQLRELN